jgi:ubiquinone/menaquinone biosynthesis C-methylase UbiE
MDKKDHTPNNFTISVESRKELIKSVLRGFIYPVLTWFMNKRLSSVYSWSAKYNKLYLGQRGNDYSAHRKKINKYSGVSGKTLLIVGCGTGGDLDSWVKYKPEKIIAIDLFNYTKAWEMQAQYFLRKYNVDVEFIQADLTDLSIISNESIDIIGSDAVFEHLKEFDKCLQEMKRVLSKDGLLYSTFGPLWNCWGGDHISGSDSFNNGYNHILLDKSDYINYLNSFGEYNHDSNDGRTWIYNDLFSYYKPSDYIQSLEDLGFSFSWKSVILDPRSIKFLNDKGFEERLTKKGLTDEELIISGMTIIVKK